VTEYLPSKHESLISNPSTTTKKKKKRKKEKNSQRGQAWWYTPVIPALGRLRQEDLEFEASMDYIAKPNLQKKTPKPNRANEQI
jgi:hypothetical protein